MRLKLFKELVNNNSFDLVNVKMDELKELIESHSEGHHIVYEWKNENDHELVINFIYDDLAIQYEFDLQNFSLFKVVDDQVEFEELVDSIDEGLDIIEKDVYNILGVNENKNKNMKNILKFEEFILERKNTPNDENLWQKALRWVKGTRHGGSATVRHDGETYEAPNDGKGFEVYPSAYANSAAAKKYREWGGTWRKNESYEVNEDLRDWHKEEWVRIDTQGNIAGECGSMPKGKSMQRCLPKKKAQSMTKAERAATVAKKTKGDKKGKQFVRNTEKATVSNKDRKKARS